jgi:hypothetical protein
MSQILFLLFNIALSFFFFRYFSLSNSLTKRVFCQYGKLKLVNLHKFYDKCHPNYNVLQNNKVFVGWVRGFVFGFVG